MRKLTVLLLTAALLAGCASAPADSLAPSAAPDTARSEAAPTEAPSAPEATPANTIAEQQAILEQLVDFGADTAGGSLKTACAAAALVEYLSTSTREADIMTDWRAGLTADKQELLALNWPDILFRAQAICTDPAAEADLLASAGVTTDFTALQLDAVPDRLAAADAVLGCTD